MEKGDSMEARKKVKKKNTFFFGNLTLNVIFSMSKKRQ
jgi:hypothetical protein